MNKINYLTSGESHGKSLLGIIEGIPANLEINAKDINYQLARRQCGYGRGGRMKIENDNVEILSGLRNGITMGSPIGLKLDNLDWANWKDVMSVKKHRSKQKKITLPRPGHADLAGIQKYGMDDIRNVIERSSARETAMRVAIGSVCRIMLKEVGINIASRVTQIHDVIDDRTKVDYNSDLDKLNKILDKSDLRCANNTLEKAMKKRIDKARNNGDTVGGCFEVFANGLPYGLGSYTQWNKKLQAQIAYSLMSINAFKGVEFGMGFNSANLFGSELMDEIKYHNNKYIRTQNNMGGIEGGMSNAQPLVVKVIMKPLSTLTKPLMSVDIKTKEPKLAHKERTDTCAVPAASVIAESMLCIVIADSLLYKFGGDSINQLKLHMEQSAKF
mgnify:CR=1 FL=1